jgi:peptidoglycan-associated lipoprotein
MVRLVISAAAALAVLWASPKPAESCGVKLTVKAPRVQTARTAKGAGGERGTPIQAGPADEAQRAPKDAGGTLRPGARGGGGGESPAVKTPTPPRPPEVRHSKAVESSTPASTPDLSRQPDVDTDRGGEIDTAETSPTRRDRQVRFTNRVFFANGSANLSASARSQLEQNARWLEQNRDKSVTIEGHANKVGSPDANQVLSEMRAQAARDYLIELGVEESRVTVTSFGDERPEFSPAASGKNRRVVLVVN